MNKTYTREELTAITKEQYAAMSTEEQIEIRKQGKAFLYASSEII